MSLILQITVLGYCVPKMAVHFGLL